MTQASGRLHGKIAIITGAAGGMGEAAALLFAREGAKVVACDLSADALANLVARIASEGGTALPVIVDVTDSGQVAAMVDACLVAFGPPTVLFNNAGVDLEEKRSILDIDEAAFDRTIEVNLKGAWLVLKAVARAMVDAGTGGSIVNTASIAAGMAASSAGYAASKAGLIALTKVAAVELGKHGIRVNSLSPGATETPMAREQRIEMQRNGLPTSNELIGRMGVLGRMAEPEEMARMALFLSSDDASFATGTDFVNDAGWTAMSGINVQDFAKS